MSAEPHKGNRTVRAAQLLAERLRHEAQGMDAIAAEAAELHEMATRYDRLKFELEHLADTCTDITPDEIRRMLARVDTE